MPISPFPSDLFSEMPRFVPIAPFSSDLFRFPRFLPVCSPCFQEYPDLFRFVSICSVFFRFVLICFQNNPEQIREPLSADPFCKSPMPHRTHTMDVGLRSWKPSSGTPRIPKIKSDSKSDFRGCPKLTGK